MSRPSWVEAPTPENDEAHSESGVRLANELNPASPDPAHSFAEPSSSPTPPLMAHESGVMRTAASAEPERSSAQFRASHDYDRHLDDVVRAFFPGWGASSPRASRPSMPGKGGRNV